MLLHIRLLLKLLAQNTVVLCCPVLCLAVLSHVWLLLVQFGSTTLVMPCMCLQLMDVAVKLPPFKPPKVVAVEYEAPQLLSLPELLDEEVYRNAHDSCLS